MSADTSVYGHRCPLVAEHARLRLAGIHHRLDREDHSLTQARAVSAIAEVWNLRLFMQSRSNAVPNKLAYHAESRRFHMLLHGRTHVPDRIPDPRLLDTPIQGSLGDFEQFLNLLLQAVANRYGDSRNNP